MAAAVCGELGHNDRAKHHVLRALEQAPRYRDALRLLLSLNEPPPQQDATTENQAAAKEETSAAPPAPKGLDDEPAEAEVASKRDEPGERDEASEPASAAEPSNEPDGGDQSGDQAGHQPPDAETNR